MTATAMLEVPTEAPATSDPDVFLTREDLQRRWRMSRSKFLGLRDRDRRFPRAIEFGPRHRRFRLADVLRYERELSEGQNA